MTSPFRSPATGNEPPTCRRRGGTLDFSITQKTLERLEWPRITARLAAAARTPRGRAALTPQPDAGAAAVFEPSLEAVRERHAETAEALAILAAGDAPPLAGVGDVSAWLARARKGGTLAGEALRELLGTLAALRETASFLLARRVLAPRLAALAEAVQEQASLERRIDAALEPCRRGARCRFAGARAGAPREPQSRRRDPAAARADAPGSRHARATLGCVLHGAQRSLRAAGEGRGEGRRARHRARRLALGNHRVHRARGARRAQQSPEAVGARRAARDAPRARAAFALGRRGRRRDRDRDRGLAGHRPRLCARDARAGDARDTPRGRRAGHHPRARAAPSAAPRGRGRRERRAPRRELPRARALRAERRGQDGGAQGRRARGALRARGLVRAGRGRRAGRLVRCGARRHRRRAGHPREPLDVLRAHGQPRPHRRRSRPAHAGAARRDRYRHRPQRGCRRRAGLPRGARRSRRARDRDHALQPA